jgi:tetratricopeptide (TPR) repeat protein
MVRFILFISLLSATICLKAQVSSDVRSSSNMDNDSLISRISRAESDSLKIELYSLLIGKLLMADPHLAEKYLYQSEYLITQSVDPDQFVRSRVLWMIFYNKTGKSSQVKELVEQVSSKIATVKRPKIKVSFLMEWAGYLNRMGHYAEAGEKYEELRKLAQELQLFDIELMALNNFAVMLGEQKNIGMRNEILGQVLNLANSKGFKNEAYTAKVNLAETEILLHNYGKAEEYLTGCIDYFKSSGYLIGMAVVFRHLGQIRLMTGHHTEAIEYFQKALQIRTRQNDRAGIGRLYSRLAESFMAMHQVDSAKWYSQSALKLLDSLNLVEDLKDAKLVHAEILALSNEFPSAFNYLREHIALKDSALIRAEPEKLAKQIDVVKSFYTDSLVLSRDKQIKSLSRSRTILAIMLGICLLAFTGLLGFRKKKETIQVVATDVVSGDIEKLQHQIQQLNEKEATSLKNRLLEEDNRTEAYWSEFNLYFSRIYPDFFSRLRSQYPDLNQAELKICMLMKLNLGVVELADVMSISIDGVRKARYRIYKKMNLNGDPEFADFILTF